jgi:hypothetical protein
VVGEVCAAMQTRRDAAVVKLRASTARMFYSVPSSVWCATVKLDSAAARARPRHGRLGWRPVSLAAKVSRYDYWVSRRAHPVALHSAPFA